MPWRTLVVSALTLLAGGCAEARLAPEEPAVATRLVRVSGDSQHAFRGTPLAERIVVRALDRAGDPVPRTPIRFHPSSPTALAFPAGTVMTDSAGEAAADWYLGDESETQNLLVEVPEGPRTHFTASAHDSLHADSALQHTGRISLDDREPPATFQWTPDILQIERDFLIDGGPPAVSVVALRSGDSVWVDVVTFGGGFPAVHVSRYVVRVRIPLGPDRPHHVRLRSSVYGPSSPLSAPVYFDIP